MNALELNGLTKHFGDFTLGPLSLTLPGGCILGLLGENGAGKSTTIRLILGLLQPEGGAVTILGQDSRISPTLTKQDIGVVLDEAGFPDCMTPRQVGNVMADAYTGWQKETYAALLNRFSLPENKKFREFSRGMKMKLGLAVALSHQARLLILDEATGGLDPVVRDEVVGLLAEFVKDEDHAILISSHIVSDLEKLCDYVAFLHKGKLLLFEEKDRLLGEYGILHCPPEQLRALPEGSVLHQSVTSFSAQAIVRRSALPEGTPFSPISMEELFVLMSKEAD
ncbi:MAG: ABC transporter ATP-binding protein [Candidatus Faecousia sp.]|nr:ABC transporter ATP-binding protein [Candidatus Faecousia sp.]